MASATRSTRPGRSTQMGLGDALRAMSAALAAVALVFGGYEIAERTLLEGMSMRTIHAAHIMRGLGSSVLAAAVAMWVLVRRSPQLFTAPERSDADDLSADEQRMLQYVRWFIQMRWIAVAMVAMLVVVIVKVTHQLPQEVWVPLLVCTGVLITSNLAWTALCGRRGWASRLLTPQMYCDLVVLTALVHFSGGIENPLSLLAMLHVVIAGIILERKQCYRVAAAAAGLYALMGWFEAAHLLDHYTLAIVPHGRSGEVHASHEHLFVLSRVTLQAVLLLLIAYFVVSLAERAREHERRKEALAASLMAERQLLERALETTGTGLRVVGDGLEEQWLNNRWREWFGTAVSFDWLEEGSPARRSFEDGALRVTEVSNPPEQTTANGNAGRVYQLTTAPIVDLDGTVNRVAELAQDITERKVAQEQMLQAGKMAALGELAGQIAHEINNPIAVISAKARLLLDGQDDGMSDKVRRELDKIVHYSDRVASIAQGLLSYCRPSPATRAVLDVRPPVQRALGMIEQRAAQAGIEVEEHLDGALPSVMANAGELEQVCLNLLLNALDAMPDGGRLRLATLGPDTDELATSAESRKPDRGDELPPLGDVCVLPDGRDCVAVIIEDTGVGIAASIVEKVWEPFFSTKEPGRGTGLGLSICQGLVTSHGGTIAVESAVGIGTRFIIRLPLARDITNEDSKS